MLDIFFKVHVFFIRFCYNVGSLFWRIEDDINCEAFIRAIFSICFKDLNFEIENGVGCFNWTKWCREKYDYQRNYRIIKTYKWKIEIDGLSLNKSASQYRQKIGLSRKSVLYEN